MQGDLVAVHDIRNFDYRTETDFTPAYYDPRSIPETRLGGTGGHSAPDASR